MRGLRESVIWEFEAISSCHLKIRIRLNVGICVSIDNKG